MLKKRTFSIIFDLKELIREAFSQSTGVAFEMNFHEGRLSCHVISQALVETVLSSCSAPNINHRPGGISDDIYAELLWNADAFAASREWPSGRLVKCLEKLLNPVSFVHENPILS